MTDQSLIALVALARKHGASSRVWRDAPPDVVFTYEQLQAFAAALAREQEAQPAPYDPDNETEGETRAYQAGYTRGYEDRQRIGWAAQPAKLSMSMFATSADYHAALAAQPAAQEPDNAKVICPQCCHQFRAIPQDVQRLMLDAGFEPPFTAQPAAQEPAASEQEAQPAHDAPIDTIKHLPLFMRGYDAGMKDAKASYEAHYDRAAQPAAPASQIAKGSQEPSDPKASGLVDALVAAAEPFLLIGLDEHDTEKLCDALYAVLAAQPPSAQPADHLDHLNALNVKYAQGYAAAAQAGSARQVVRLAEQALLEVSQALSGLLEYCAEQNANQGDPATDDPRVTAAGVALATINRLKPASGANQQDGT